VNPTDWKVRRSPPANAFPWIVPNQDGAGVIVEVGEGVPAERVGERVWLWLAQWRRPSGTAAQYVALPAERAVALPEGASVDLGAGLGVPALTADHCLLKTARSRRGPRPRAGRGRRRRTCGDRARTPCGCTRRGDRQQRGEGGTRCLRRRELVIDYTREDVVSRLREWSPRA